MGKILVKTSSVGGMEIDGYAVTFGSRNIMANLESAHKTNTEFYLPEEYTYKLVKSSFWGNAAKVIYKQNMCNCNEGSWLIEVNGLWQTKMNGLTTDTNHCDLIKLNCKSDADTICDFLDIISPISNHKRISTEHLWIDNNQNKNNMYNVTCLVTGKSDNLRMHAMRNEKGEMIGWVFLHESLSLEDIETDVVWKYKTSSGNIAMTKTGLKSTN